ncbi:MFS general substrate transporter [Venustampulla echinocandica]|uniref:MFS general substrate transporter n=1 Tax=Venustampulla echinocandica TaxID=2656787 RepID=A0A370T8T5_9HELO|nr:MFS general substrate transporter [Venustampulla echinocandica]RDL29896.1 MFS general substrate transporter [Venustampulla echinocandica]
MTQENKTADAQIMLGADAHLDMDRKGSMVETDPAARANIDEDYVNRPTEEERTTLRRIPGSLPAVAYVICAVEFAERASYYGVQPLFANYVNRKMPTGGNGYGAPPAGSELPAGALGMGTVKATSVSQSFSMLAYTLPLVFGWLADTKTGRFKMICYGVGVCGVAHVIMVAAGAPSLLASGNAKIPFFLSVYILSVGAAMFKPNISPTLLDQMQSSRPETKVLKTGEKVIVDPEHTAERAMLWFYLLINIGGFMNVPTTYTEKYVGWWLSFLLPLFLYMPLLPLLWYLRKRLILYPPGGSDLTNVFRVLGVCFKRGGFLSMFRRRKGKSFFDPAKPSVIAQSGRPLHVPWNDEFVNDVRRAFQATGIFMFFPIQNINDNGLGNSANALTTMLKTKGVPNDVIGNFNSLSIILMAPVLNFGLYPLLRKWKIHFGPVARITFGLSMAAVAGAGYAIINYYAYKLGPCGNHGTTGECEIGEGVADITIWWMAIPYALGGISELFVNVPAYGIAYSRAPPNMRSLVSAINLFNSAIAYALGLAFAGLIKDPYLTWDFGAPAIIGVAIAIAFYWIYRDIDKEEYTLSTNTQSVDPAEGSHLKVPPQADLDASSEGEATSDKRDVAPLPPYAVDDVGGEKRLESGIQEVK